MVAPYPIYGLNRTNSVCKQMTDVKLWRLYSNTWNHLTVCKKKSSGSFKNVIYKMCLYIFHHHHHHHHVMLLAWISWPCLVTFPYHSSPLACLLDYIPYLHIAAVCMFLLVVLLLLGHMWGSIGVHHLWAHPCSSSSVLHAWFV